LRTRVGRVTIGVLIAQDLAVVPMMLTLSAMAGDSFQWSALPKIAFSILFLVWLIWFLSRGRKIFLPYSAMVGGHRDLTPLAALAFCLGAAAVSGLMGLSAAYGAFLAGLVIGNSHQRHAMLAVVEPLQSILMMVFFLSIGLLVDLDYLWENLGAVLLLLTMVTIFKTVLNVAILHLLGEPWQRAFLVGVTIAQIGEFSFLLAVVGLDSGLITPEDRRLIVAVTVLSLALSPLWVVIGRRLHDLADDGITSGQRLIQLVYAPEAEFVLGTLGEARSLTMRQARTLAIILRRKLLWRLRGKPENLAVKPPPVEDLHSKIALATDVRMDVSGEAVPVAISAVNLAPSEGPDPSTMERQPFRKPSRRRRSTAAVVTGARTGILSPDKPTKTGRPQRPKKPGKKNS
jgi:CPA2 family monovalent cation:H+ antiporter-2